MIANIAPRQEDLFARRVVLFLDGLVIAVSFSASYAIRVSLPTEAALQPFSNYLWILWMIVPTWLYFASHFGLYASSTYQSLEKLPLKLLKTHAIASLSLLSMMYVTRSVWVSRFFLEIFITLGYAAIFAERLAVWAVFRRIGHTSATHARQVLIVGTGPEASRLATILAENPHWRAAVAGFLSTSEASPVKFCAAGRVLGKARDLESVFDEMIVDEVILAETLEDRSYSDNLAASCLERGLIFRQVVTLPKVKAGDCYFEQIADGLCLLSVMRARYPTGALVIKRVIDIIGSLVGIVLCGIAYLIFVRRILRESPGPAIFRQTRVGQNGRRFTLYKFRTMEHGAEAKLGALLALNEMSGHVFKIQNDPRVTPTGRFLRKRHLDELPQFFNVLRGDLSLVGTRPPTVAEVGEYRPHHHRRLSMKPGITGQWQISGNGTLKDFNEIVKLDCDYIDNWSLWLDLRILLRTIVKVAKGSGW